MPDLVRARNLPSMQLVGSPQRATVDLNSLRRLGVRLVGRLAGIRDGTAQFSGSLPNVCALADLKLGRLLDTIDGWVDRTGVDVEHPPQRFAPTEVPAPVPLSLRLGAGEIATIVWATGYRHELPWLDAPVFDRKGRVVHDGGVTSSPGLYLIGLPFLRRRKSTLIDGAGGGRPRADRPPGRVPGHDRPPAAGRPAGELREARCSTIPSRPAIAAAVARRDPQRLSAALTETVRLRALLPGGPVESQGRDGRRRPLLRLVRRLRHRRGGGVGAEAVADRLLIHYRLGLSQATTRWVCTQTAVCKVVDGRLAVIDLLCSGFREMGNDESAHAPSGARLVG